MRIVILGLSITSSWGNGHATTYRGLVRALDRAGHDVLFLERDVPWYRDNRDLGCPPYGRTFIYRDLGELTGDSRTLIRDADVVLLGSFVPEGATVARWLLDTACGVTVFYDIDTPVTMAQLDRGDHDFIAPDLIPRFDLYLSFTGGPMLRHLETVWGARRARVLYCSVDPGEYHPEPRPIAWDLGYLGTYSEDRHPLLGAMLLEPARRWPEGRFAVAGSQYPGGMIWPANVERIDHVPPGAHRRFYNGMRYTLNITRSAMVRAGWSPSVRLFEAAACGVPIISDSWPGLDDVLAPGSEVLVAASPEEVLQIVRELPEDERQVIAARARARVLSAHTAAHRAAELETYLREAMQAKREEEEKGVPRWVASS